ncbi:MAG: aminotransferase class III-fold pyridoxal phosphate-dependent enzyme [Chlamydiales bacterium]|nr:aminotransferase class III-fold pyridoxal phosphate-dependent enzyme [Chlamydiia bacterium]MCP5508329.1 aminotransferase class III-fold pyridoxal phosphate-dependent enzyme [Chlamydiales bacterium]
MSHFIRQIEEAEGLASAKLMRDPRIEEAKKLIRQAVEDHRQTITAVRPPQEKLKEDYNKAIRSFGQYRGGSLWYPYLGSGIGNGALVELLDGSIKYDFISGIGVHFWGHSHLDLVDASVDAAVSDLILQGHLQQNADSVKFSEMLVKASGLDHCFLTTSGAMANENALKIAFQKNYPANRVLAFEHCFAGRTLAVSQITDKPAFRQGLPDTLHVDYIPFYDVERPEESLNETLHALDKILKRYPQQHAVMIMELVQGEAGFYPGSTPFFEAVMKKLKEHKIAILVDEVQSFGRTPSLFAYQYFGLEKYVDIVTIGKLSQVCATLFRNEMQPKPGLLSQTFTGSTAVIRAAHVIINGLINGNYYGPHGRIEQIHNKMTSHLKEIEREHPSVISGPYGIGCMIAFTPLDGTMEKALKFTHDLFEAGVISFIAGSAPARVRFLVPAGAITDEDIENASLIIRETLLKQEKS